VTPEKVIPNKLMHDSAFGDPGYMTTVWQMIMKIIIRLYRNVVGLFIMRVIEILILTSHVLQQHSNVVGVENLHMYKVVAYTTCL